ncbi:galactokinase [Klebsormidium nitens]|uniref:Galactokinase n=1 Tax=Klebsormidium nitens TaxID=105231 RepID=A0A0U9HHN8_KLENI|nr:galactokinase [Klebsormidium nitens]|eukprot:GAQ77636.1 galactokinase [Klebsormidium nitens]
MAESWKMAHDNSTSSQHHDSPLVFAYYVTGHGLGHATRVVEVTRHLIDAGHVVHVVTAAPENVFFREIQSANLHVRKVLLDTGAVQSDALTVNRIASLEQYMKTAVLPRESLLKDEAAWLKSVGANLVVSDVVPIACAAASAAGIPSMCVSNFSWDYIFAEYVIVAGAHHRSLLWQIADDYSQALGLLRLPGYCPMPAFRNVLDVPLVVRPVRRSRQQVRAELGVSEDTKLLLFNFGGQDASWQLQASFLPPGWKCLVCTALPVPALPPNFLRPHHDAYTPDLINACDCMLGKIGYGTASEALAMKKPFVFVRRDYFSEEPFLRKMLEIHRCAVEMKRQDFFEGRWQSYLDRAAVIHPNYSGRLDGGKVAARLLQDAALGRLDTRHRQGDGVGRLRDAIVLGYQLHRMPGRLDIDVPEWYHAWASEAASPAPSPLHGSPLPELRLLDTQPARMADQLTDSALASFTLLHGDLSGRPDTAAFLVTLARLQQEGDLAASDSAAQPTEREKLAAGTLFRWEDELVVARAPGRLDVMGGIADYSGSLVLQMPIKEAAHVALQRSDPAKAVLWKHTIARQKAKGRYPQAALHVVSFGADKTNRSPTFDLDLADLLDPATGQPLEYAAARALFERDPSQRWAAYVAGTVLVLMREKGLRCGDSLAILVQSAVPEGKGVSSSAAVEVATMTAVAAAFDLSIPPAELAALCQLVENAVCGSPCGIMDQMASCCGHAGKLLALVCQPARVLGHVDIPPHIALWGVDSGIRHAVTGADYGSVRVGAFMGKRLIQEAAHGEAAGVATRDTGDADGDDGLASAAHGDAQLEYLVNVPPHRYEALYAPLLSEEMTGHEFVARYGSHHDPVTSIAADKTYPVRAPTAHPIYEHFRVAAFSELMRAPPSAAQLRMLGELMFQSHTSYGRCGLGSDGTDRLVGLVQGLAGDSSGATPAAGLYGAKITGGGSGGTVCVLGAAGEQSKAQIKQLKQRYKRATGHSPYIFEGSSPGAAQFGHLRIRRRPEQAPPSKAGEAAQR